MCHGKGVKWVNECEESGQPFDFVLTSPPGATLEGGGDHSQSVWVEVKTTTRSQLNKSNGVRASFSTSELQWALKTQDRYWLLCIVVDAERPSCFPPIRGQWAWLQTYHMGATVTFKLQTRTEGAANAGGPGGALVVE